MPCLPLNPPDLPLPPPPPYSIPPIPLPPIPGVPDLCCQLPDVLEFIPLPPIPFPPGTISPALAVAAFNTLNQANAAVLTYIRALPLECPRGQKVAAA